MTDCVFCQIVRGDAPATVVYSTPSHTVIVPLHPHAPGHLLFIPNQHVADAAEFPVVASSLFEHAARWVRDNKVQANILTSVGADATQTVFHLHIHVVPRGPEDRLPHWWPWNKRDNDDVKLEVERLTGWKNEALEVLSGWEAAYNCLPAKWRGHASYLGRSKSEVVRAYIEGGRQ